MEILERKIKRNVFFQFVQFFLLLPVGFILTPFIIGKLGRSTYGVWALIATIISFLGISDLNISTALTKFVAEYYSQKDYQSINKVVNTAFVTLFIVGSVIYFILILLVRKIAVTFFHSADIPVGLIRFLFIIGLSAFVLRIVFSSFSSIIGGLLRFDIYSKLRIISEYFSLGGIFLVLTIGFGLKGLVITQAIVSVGILAVYLLIVRRLLPEVRLNPFLFDFRLLKKILGFSTKVFITTLAGLANFQIDKIILGYFLQISSVTFYQVAAGLVRYIRVVPSLFVDSIMPATAELENKGDRVKVQELFLRFNKYVILFALPLVYSLLVFVRPFIRLWLGEGYQNSIITVMFFSVCYFINILGIVPHHILLGMGKAVYAMYSAVLIIVLNISLSILFVMRYGYIGAVWGTFISMIIGGIYFQSIFYRFTSFPFWKTVKFTLIKPLLGGGFASLIILTTFVSVKESWFGLIYKGMIFIFLYLLCLLILKHFDEFDKKFFRDFISGRVFRTLLIPK